MNDLETLQYLFDVQGYLVLENVLDAEQVAALNHLLDAHCRRQRATALVLPPMARAFWTGASPSSTCSTTPRSCPCCASA